MRETEKRLINLRPLISTEPLPIRAWGGGMAAPKARSNQELGSSFFTGKGISGPEEHGKAVHLSFEYGGD